MMISTPRYPVVLAILAALGTLGMKSLAYWLTDSVGLLSDAVESLINLLAAVVALVCLWYAARPVDPTHTYGHEKIEYFSSGLEGVLILVAAGGIAWAAIDRLLHPRELEELGLGTAIALAASLVNLGVAYVLLREGRASRSLLLEASGRHLLTDVWTSVGIVAGLVVVAATGWGWLDPALALLVSCNILWTGARLLVHSFNGLMDHALPEAEQAAVRAAIQRSLEAGATFHALRTRRAGTRRFIDFHLLVPGAWSVRLGHDLSERVEAAVRDALAGSEVTIHIEPIEERAAWQDSDLLSFEPPVAQPAASDRPGQ